MLNFKSIIFLSLAILSACTVTGPADDGYDNSNEWVDNGRLLSAESKTIYGSDNQQIENPVNNTGLDLNAFKQWQQAKENNSPEYQLFKQWQEFEEYQRWKDKQNAE